MIKYERRAASRPFAALRRRILEGAALRPANVEET